MRHILIELQQALIQQFNLSELKTLCLDMKLNFETIPGENLNSKAEELVRYLDRRSQIKELLDACTKARPNHSWEKYYDVLNQSFEKYSESILRRKSIYISHDPVDRKIAELLAETISRITLGQIRIVLSKNISSPDTTVPLNLWFHEVSKQLNLCEFAIVLLTPNSTQSPWLFFESGLGAANKSCELIPVGISIDGTNDVPLPLAFYQCYQLSDYSAFKRLIIKFLKKFDINFDEEMQKPILESALSKILETSIQSISKNHLEPEINSNLELFEDLKQHFDRRFLNLMNQINDSDFQKIEKAPGKILYSVPIYFNLTNAELKQSKQYFDVFSDSTIQEMLNRIYSYLHPIFPTFTYLEKWILQERKTGIRLIIREVTNRIPAQLIFSPSSEWEVVELLIPYTPSESTELQEHLETWFFDNS